MLIRSPITIGSLSPRTTDPNQILDPEPTTTFPMIVAHGAIQHDGRTLLVAHNIDLAPRVPLHAGDAVSLRGEYEWNPEGGVIHETHHATSAGGAPGGWVRFAGTTYQ